MAGKKNTEEPITCPQWILERYKQKNGFEAKRLVSPSRNIPADIQIFAIAAHGYTDKPWETNFWKKFEGETVSKGSARKELLKTENGRNEVRRHLLNWVTSEWY